MNATNVSDLVTATRPWPPGFFVKPIPILNDFFSRMDLRLSFAAGRCYVPETFKKFQQLRVVGLQKHRYNRKRCDVG